MAKQTPSVSIRLSLNQIRSNPILASQREFRRDRGRRDNERRQLARLKKLQSEGVPLFCFPQMIREDAFCLTLTKNRIGVVGLVVDNYGEGYVTQLQVKPNPTWDISVDLPFRQVHIQSLLLRVLSGQGLDDSLPELLAFRITDTLKDRCEGDSMDVACLLAIIDASVKHESEMLSAAAAVVSPADDGLLEASKSVFAKLNAFTREFGHGSLLIRHIDDEEAARFDGKFDEVWPVSNLVELAARLDAAGLMRSLLEKVSLRTEHGFAIASQIQSLLSSESTFAEAEDFLSRLRRRTSEAPLKIRLEISLAEEDLHRHRGNFDAAIAARSRRVEQERNPLISCYEREADSDNRHAAALYDAHRFTEAIACLEPWIEKFNSDPKICLPETRAKLLNTLARCMVVTGDPNWESLYEQSLAIQTVADPGNVSTTTNFRAHGYLKSSRFEVAREVLNIKFNESDFFRIWLAAECSRQAGAIWSESECEKALNSIPESDHVHGFACQAIARQLNRPAESRLQFFENARRSFNYGLKSDVSNVKRVLHAFCSFAIAVVADDSVALDQAINEFRAHCAGDGFCEVRNWYQQAIDGVERNRDWTSIETLFARIPHL